MDAFASAPSRAPQKIVALVSAGAAAWVMWARRLVHHLTEDPHRHALLVSTSCSLPAAALRAVVGDERLQRLSIVSQSSLNARPMAADGCAMACIIGTLEAAAAVTHHYSCVIVDTPAWESPHETALSRFAACDVAELRRASRVLTNRGVAVYLALPRSRVAIWQQPQHGDLVLAAVSGTTGQAYRLGGGALWSSVPDVIIYAEFDRRIPSELEELARP
jgi:hypothetical protein